MPEELTPTERHARVVAEIMLRLRIVLCALDTLPSHSLAARAKHEHVRELEALLEVAERHCPLDDSDKCAGACLYCAEDSADFPCQTFLSCEKILAKPSPSE